MRKRLVRILLALIAWGSIAIIFIKLGDSRSPYAPLWMLLGLLMGMGAAALTLAALERDP